MNIESFSGKREDSILCSVCVATYRRPQLLEKLLKSLEKQVFPENVHMEVIVVDNDSDRSASQVINQKKNDGSICIKYFTQPRKNISLTRNLAIEKASGQYILFIDDDEVVSTAWLYHLFNTAIAYNADGVFGLVVPEFHPEAPQWIRNRDFYFRPMEPTGTEAKFTFSGNCLIKASILKKLKEPFDPRYGITGGGDTIFFDRLAKQGARFINCLEAVTFEFMPPYRTSLSYLLRRALKGGNTFSRKMIDENIDKYQLITRLLMFTKGLSHIFVSFILLVIFLLHKVHRIKWMIKMATNIGRLLAVFNWYYKAYK